MGYEIRLYIGRTDGKPSSMDNGHSWLQVYAMVDLCKPGYDSAIYLLNRGKVGEPTEPLVFFYAEDGNTSVQEDRYGTKLRAYPIAAVLDAIQSDAQRDQYRRFDWALATLKAIHKDEPSAVVALYGY